MKLYSTDSFINIDVGQPSKMWHKDNVSYILDGTSLSVYNNNQQKLIKADYGNVLNESGVVIGTEAQIRSYINAMHPLQTSGGGGVTTLSALTDTLITVAASGELLMWNGTQWVNTTLSAAGIEPEFTKNTAFNKDFGATGGTVAEGNDTRFSDARTPTAHTHVKADITDFNYGKVQLTAGESLVSGNLCYLKSDGKYWKANASAEATSSTELRMCNATIAANAVGEFIKPNHPFTTSGLTMGDKYWVSLSTGQITNTQPSATGEIVRYVGSASSTTVLEFNPDGTYIELT